MIDWSTLLDIRRVRDELSLSQAQLADLVGVSIRTVQSCEQGWRRPGVALEKSLLLLLMAFRNGTEFGAHVCWQTAEREPGVCERCIVRWCSQAHLCWLFSGNMCQGKRLRSWAEKKAVCGECRFLHQLLEGTNQQE